MHQLSRDDLITILTEPRNALVKQFQRFFQFDGIELVFSDDALISIADKALERETGARGLRSIIEEMLLEVQFELPSRRDVKKCVVTKETIEQGLPPTLVTEARDRDGTAKAARRVRSRRRILAIAKAVPPPARTSREAVSADALAQAEGDPRPDRDRAPEGAHPDGRPRARRGRAVAAATRSCSSVDAILRDLASVAMLGAVVRRASLAARAGADGSRGSSRTAAATCARTAPRDRPSWRRGLRRAASAA